MTSKTVPTLRVLLAEDVAADAELEIREIKRAGLRVSHRIVESEKDVLKALREFAPDVILWDFSMPQSDGMEALRLAKELAPDTPFIFVSGTLGEEYAIRALKSGATDYVVKSNLVRLSAAVERALAEAKLLRERRQTEAELEIARERLQEREAGLRRAQLMAKLAHVITGPDGSFESWSDTLPALIGTQLLSMPRSTRKWLDIVHPEDREALRAKSIEAGATGRRVDIEYRLRREGAEWIHVRQVIEPLGGQPDPGSTERWFSTLQDITDQKRAEDRIKRLNRVYAMLSGINTLIVRVRDREELYREACRMAVAAGQFRMAWIGVVDQQSGLVKPVASAGEVGDFFESAPLAVIENKPGGHGLAGRAIRGKKPMLSNDIKNDPQRLMRKELDERGINSLAVIPLIVGGEAIGVLALYAAEGGAFDNDEMRLLLELAGDISFALGHIEKAEKLEYLAYYDPLTGLANRSLFLERLQQKVIAAGSSQRKLAVSIVDIERFKAINDAYGRQAGDELLRQLADRIKSAGPDPTRVARIGPDHFAIVSDVENEDDVGRLTEQRLATCLGPAFRLDGRELRLSARVGIAMYPGDGGHAEALFANAEAALKKAKATGERYLFFAPAMTERIHENLSLENKLREALDKEEFVLHYQPKVDVENRGIVGVEALIRWQSPELGLVPPMKFIPLLEETGLILQVGSWALRRAALHHRPLADRATKPPRVAANG